WESVKTALFGREVFLPPVGPGAEGGTTRVGGLAGFSLPSLTVPDWASVIDSSRSAAEAAWARVKSFFGSEEAASPKLPPVDVPDWSGAVDAARERLEERWSRLTSNLTPPTWPEMEPFSWPEIEPFEWPEITPFSWPEIEPFAWPEIEHFEWPEVVPPD